jgi:hypothetical protein
MIIQVTQEHIDHGTRNSCYECPVALALHENLLGKNEVRVIHYIEIIGEDVSLKYKLPDSVVHFIKRFDKGIKVEPFEFELTNQLPSWV